jgi:hypothetical protein
MPVFTTVLFKCEGLFGREKYAQAKKGQSYQINEMGSRVIVADKREKWLHSIFLIRVTG